MPKAYLIYGFVGAGKTTFALHLERATNAIRFTIDEWVHRLYGIHMTPQDFSIFKARVNELMWSYVARIFELGMDVIIDDGFWARTSRDEARNRIKALGGSSVLYRVECPEYIMKERVKKRDADLQIYSVWIGKHNFESFKTRFEELADDEEYISIDGCSMDKYAKVETL